MVGWAEVGLVEVGLVAGGWAEVETVEASLQAEYLEAGDNSGVADVLVAELVAAVAAAAAEVVTVVPREPQRIQGRCSP